MDPFGNIKLSEQMLDDFSIEENGSKADLDHSEVAVRDYFRATIGDSIAYREIFTQEAEELTAKLKELNREKKEIKMENDETKDEQENVEHAVGDVNKKFESNKGTLDQYYVNQDILKEKDAKMAERVNKYSDLNAESEI